MYHSAYPPDVGIFDLSENLRGESLVTCWLYQQRYVWKRTLMATIKGLDTGDSLLKELLGELEVELASRVSRKQESQIGIRNT
jgi:hypothetical protein